MSRRWFVFAVAALGCHNEPEVSAPVHAPPVTQVRPNEIQRGAYVATISGCTVCHGQDLSGQKLGDVTAPNITPDRDTGIGTWSDADLMSAVRMMKLPSGDDIGQPMSFYKDAWAKLADDDARALVQFAHSV